MGNGTSRYNELNKNDHLNRLVRWVSDSRNTCTNLVLIFILTFPNMILVFYFDILNI